MCPRNVSLPPELGIGIDRFEGFYTGARKRPAMDVDRETVVEVVVSVGAVGLLVAVIIGIGQVYNQGGLSAGGGVALVGAIAAFVVMMALIGVGLAYYLNSD